MHGFRSWIVGGIVWGAVSLTVISAFVQHGTGKSTFQPGSGESWLPMWFLCSLVWFQFGFAALFNALLRQRFSHIRDQILTALAPPVLLHFVVSIVSLRW